MKSSLNLVMKLAGLLSKDAQIVDGPLGSTRYGLVIVRLEDGSEYKLTVSRVTDAPKKRGATKGAVSR